MKSLSGRGIHPGLEGVKMLCDACGNPEKELKVIHVAGTNGKGSTALYIEQILIKSGYRVGKFTSPAVFEERETIRYNGRNISQKDYAELVDIISQKNTMNCTGFEAEVVLGFLYFQKKNCDVVVLEAGMGGELDATNVYETSLASVFTSIGMDHAQYLGNTVDKIARTKAGIIRPGSVTVSTLQEAAVTEEISRIAKDRGSELVLSDYSKASNINYTLKGTSFSYKGFKKVRTVLLGTYQVINACLAIDTCLALQNRLVNITNKSILAGLATASEGGRFEIIDEKPLFIIDGAHNEPASLRFKENIETYFTNRNIIFIIGMLKDKDCEKVIKNTAKLASIIFTVATPNRSRTHTAIELAEIVREVNPNVTAVDSIEEAVEFAYMIGDKDTVVVAYGSLSHLNAIKKAVESKAFAKCDGRCLRTKK